MGLQLDDFKVLFLGLMESLAYFVVAGYFATIVKLILAKLVWSLLTSLYRIFCFLGNILKSHLNNSSKKINNKLNQSILNLHSCWIKVDQVLALRSVSVLEWLFRGTLCLSTNYTSIRSFLLKQIPLTKKNSLKVHHFHHTSKIKQNHRFSNMKEQLCWFALMKVWKSIKP